MKLFKKLAAVALAAVLALSMVGCGAAVTAKDYYLNAIDDYAYMEEEDIVHVDAFDTEAEKILQKVSEKYTDGSDPNALLKDLSLWEEAGVETGYYVTIIQAVQFKSAVMNAEFMRNYVYYLLKDDDIQVGTAKPTEGEVQFGIAVGTLDGRDVVLTLKRFPAKSPD